LRADRGHLQSEQYRHVHDEKGLAMLGHRLILTALVYKVG
jgi:hypothetical protein